MNKELSSFAARLREVIPNWQSAIGNRQFSKLALELFVLQYKHNAAYQKICSARGVTPEVVEDWIQIPAVPTAAFKELELSCLPPEERTAVFHSSGTTEQRPSRHFHSVKSLAVYETSLWQWFKSNVLANSKLKIHNLELIILTPPPAQAPHSSLIHMFEAIRHRACEDADRSFFGRVAADGAWTIDFDVTLAALDLSLATRHPSLLLGTAFSLVHLLDFLIEHELRFQLPPGSRVMETGGYKNRSRTLPKDGLHELITERLGIPANDIICEYGMSELSSQAYDNVTSGAWRAASNGTASRHFHFPPWARVQIISPETGNEVAEGETGLIRVFDLANVFSVMAVQTEDLGVRRGDGFKLIGRAQFVEPRGCSLMNA